MEFGCDNGYICPHGLNGEMVIGTVGGQWYRCWNGGVFEVVFSKSVGGMKFTRKPSHSTRHMA